MCRLCSSLLGSTKPLPCRPDGLKNEAFETDWAFLRGLALARPIYLAITLSPTGRVVSHTNFSFRRCGVVVPIASMGGKRTWEAAQSSCLSGLFGSRVALLLEPNLRPPLFRTVGCIVDALKPTLWFAYSSVLNGSKTELQRPERVPRCSSAGSFN